MTKEEMYEIIENGTQKEKEELVKRPDLPEDLIYKLAEDDYWITRWGIARRPDLPVDLVYKLAEDEHGGVRREIALRPDLPEDLMYKLAEDKEWEIRHAVVRYDLPIELLVRLCCDTGWHSSISDSIIELKKLKSLTKEDLIGAYDLIYNSKHIDREYLEYTFNYLSKKFPELSEIIDALKKLLLKKV